MFCSIINLKPARYVHIQMAKIIHYLNDGFQLQIHRSQYFHTFGAKITEMKSLSILALLTEVQNTNMNAMKT